MKDKPLTYILFFLCILWTASGPFYPWKGIENFDRSIFIWLLGVIGFMGGIIILFKIEERKVKSGRENKVLGGIVSGAISLILSGIFLCYILKYAKEGYPLAYIGIPGVILFFVSGLLQIKDSLFAKQSMSRYETFLQ